MATLTELTSLFGDGDLTNKVAAAIIVKAQEYIDGTVPTPTAAEKAWAAKAFQSPKVEAQRILKSVLAANAGATVAAIQGASDAAIQTNVNSAVQLFIDSDAGV